MSMATEEKYEIVIPFRFYQDHWDRCTFPQTAEIIKFYKSGKIKIKINEDELDELYDDALFYSEGAGGLNSEYNGLIKSAKATVRAIQAWESEQAGA